MTAAYLDASAVVKLFKPEAETGSLAEELARHPAWVSSEIVAVEARCTARRLGGGYLLSRAEEVLGNIELIGLSQAIRDRAGEAFEPPLRALDAIHAATVVAVGVRVDGVFVYDSDLRRAIAAQGIGVTSPGLLA